MQINKRNIIMVIRIYFLGFRKNYLFSENYPLLPNPTLYICLSAFVRIDKQLFNII